MGGHSPSSTEESDEYWIGVDWGTTNCAVAIYSRSLGRTKWMRLGPGCPISGSEGERRRWKQSYQLAEQQKNGKVGRIMPSVLILASTTKLPIFKCDDSSSNDNDRVKYLQLKNDSSAYYLWYNVSDLLSQKPVKEHQQLWVCVGAAAERFISATMLSDDCLDLGEESKVFSASVRSVKRLVLKELASRTRISLDSMINTMHEITKSIVVSIKPLGCDEMLHLDAVTIAAIFLRAIRFASDDYLRRPKVRQKLGFSPHPHDAGQSRQHCCLGVPATASLAYRSFLQEAAQRAGFSSSTCITESTAAAIAYGLFTRDHLGVSISVENETGETSPRTKQTIVVFDMGGGTTDITIAEREFFTKKSKSIGALVDEAENMDFHVCVTVGNDQLGGDDMDQAIMRLVQTKLTQQPIHYAVDTNQLLLKCRAAKLLLCGGEDGEISASAPINVRGASISISQEEFKLVIQPILDHTRELIQSALDRYQVKLDSLDTRIDEVILIGGASRVPAIRELLQDIFIAQPKLRTDQNFKGGFSELCTSVNAMSAVAQGCAVSAALVSGIVPFHELKSSYMLDTTPYSIGVLLNTADRNSGLVDEDDDTSESSSPFTFVEILSQGASLPAAGYSTFVLADVGQAGISLTAAEQICDPSATDAKQRRYNILGEFTFLLHRLSKAKLATMKTRSVDVGMTLKDNGEFVVSIFDQNDPDHIRKKESYQKVKSAEKTGSAHLDMKSELPHSDEPLSWEQVSLLLSCVVLLILYVASKVTFSDPESIQTVTE